MIMEHITFDHLYPKKVQTFPYVYFPMLPFKKKSFAQHEVCICNCSIIELIYNHEYFHCGTTYIWFDQVTSKCWECLPLRLSNCCWLQKSKPHLYTYYILVGFGDLLPIMILHCGYVCFVAKHHVIFVFLNSGIFEFREWIIPTASSTQG